MTVKALETHYAGCRFRSRLEARWAVFFDRLGVRWEYEPEGYLIGSCFDDSAETMRPYLPDFRLPDSDLWVEVKGEASALDLPLMVNATVSHWGLPGSGILLLGPLPRVGGRPAHSLLWFRKGDVWRDWAEFNAAGLLTRIDTNDHIGNDGGSYSYPDPNLIDPVYFRGKCDPLVAEAYRAARSARFEHGERG